MRYTGFGLGQYVYALFDEVSLFLHSPMPPRDFNPEEITRKMKMGKVRKYNLHGVKQKNN